MLAEYSASVTRRENGTVLMDVASACVVEPPGVMRTLLCGYLESGWT